MGRDAQKGEERDEKERERREGSRRRKGRRRPGAGGGEDEEVGRTEEGHRT